MNYSTVPKYEKKILKNMINNADQKLNNFMVFSGNHYTFESALNEIFKLQQDSKLIKWFSAITALVYLPDGIEKFYKAIKLSPPIFLQHIFPIKNVFEMEIFSSDINEFADIISNQYSDLITSLPFSVQTEIFDKNYKYTAFDISKAISDRLLSKGKILNVKNPWHIISILIDDNTAYVGISTSEQNLSKWSSGIVHYSKEFNRAEHKLIECIKYFEMELSGGNALDMGAAPGGWTKKLSERGYKVWAVDPAELDDNIKSLSGVTHIKKIAQHFLRNNTITFNMIVNDMVMDCRESANIMNDAVDFLTRDGFGIITAKLPKKGYNKRLKTAVKILSRKFVVCGVRQLPSNKSEVTILLSKKNII